MTSLALAAGSFCLFATALHFVSSGLALARCRRWRPAPELDDAPPPVTVLRPVCGVDPVIEATLPSTFALEGVRYEVIFCVASNRDPVVPLVRRLVDEYPHVPTRLLVGEEQINQNPKLNNIAKGWRAAEHGWIAMVDDNVLLGPDSVARLMADWGPDTGLVASPPIGADPHNLAAEIECAFLNTFQARWQYAADAAGLGFAQGKVMFFRRDIIEAAGGIEMLGREAAEDAATTKIVRAAGKRVRLVSRPFAQPLGARRWAAVWRRQVRWARLRRVTFPLFFLPEVLTGSVFPSAAFAVFAVGMELPLLPLLAAYLAAWYGAEAVLARGVGWHLSWRAPAAWVARDLLLPVLWLQAWAGNEFEWRGNEMRVARSGRSAA
jgi:ceramide glucosyltransferase